MEEIPNNHLRCLKPCRSCNICHINWCRISSMNSLSRVRKIQTILRFFHKLMSKIKTIGDVFVLMFLPSPQQPVEIWCARFLDGWWLATTIETNIILFIDREYIIVHLKVFWYLVYNIYIYTHVLYSLCMVIYKQGGKICAYFSKVLSIPNTTSHQLPKAPTHRLRWFTIRCLDGQGNRETSVGIPLKLMGDVFFFCFFSPKVGFFSVSESLWQKYPPPPWKFSMWNLKIPKQPSLPVFPSDQPLGPSGCRLPRVARKFS